MVLSPDQSIMDVVYLYFRRHGITVGHRQSIERGQVPWFRETSSDQMSWASIMYRWVYLQVVVSASKIEVYYAGEARPIVELTAIKGLVKEKFRIPKYIHMLSVGATVMVGVDEVNREGVHCSEGLVKMAIHPWQATWGVVPLVDPQPAIYPPLTGVTPEVYEKIKIFYERKLKLQIYNVPTSLLITSKPLLLKEVRRSLEHLKVNGVQVIVGSNSIKIIKCGLIKSLRNYREITCAGDSVFTKEYLTSERSVGDSVIVEMVATEDPASDTSAELRIKHGQSPVTVTKLQHPIFPRYWSLTKRVLRKEEKNLTGPVFFRLLSDKCTPKASNWYTPSCQNAHGDQRTVGVVTWTQTGKTCMPWSAFDGSESKFENKCKVDASGLWCFINLYYRKEKCYAPTCGEVMKKCNAVPGLVERNYTDLYALEYHKEQNTAKQTGVERFMGMQPTSVTRVCDDLEDVFLVNIMAQASTDGPTHFVVAGEKGYTKVSFLLRSWNHELGDDGICLYLSDKKKEQVRVMISQRTVMYSDEDGQHLTSHPSYIVFWRYVKYSLVRVKGWWALYQDEKVEPVFRHQTEESLWQIRFDSCHKKEPKTKNQTPKYVMVKMEPSEKLPSVKQIFKTGYFTDNPHSNRYKKLYKNYNPTITDATPLSQRWLEFQNYDDMVAELDSYQRMDSEIFDLWFKGGKVVVDGREDRRGGALLVLLSSMYPKPKVEAMIDIQPFMVGVRDHKGRWNRQDHETFFLEYMCRVRMELRHTSKGGKKRLGLVISLYPPVQLAEIRQPLHIPVSVSQVPRYVGFGSHRMKLYWTRSLEEPPQDLLSRPVDGGWSEWEEKECSQMCGGGRGMLVRTCTNPSPSSLGQNCHGKSVRVDVPCNTSPCGMISETIANKILHEIISVDKNRRVIMTASTRLRCKAGEAYKAVSEEFPDAEYFWQHKSGRYTTDNTRDPKSILGKVQGAKHEWQVRQVYVDGDSNLVVENALPEQSGLWMCVAQTGPEVFAVVQAIPFTVEPNRDLDKPWHVEGSQIMLSCGAQDLSRLTSGNIMMTWLHNDTVYQELRDVNTDFHDVLVLPHAVYKDSGTWECVLTHQTTKTTYYTALYQFTVVPDPELNLSPYNSPLMDKKRAEDFKLVGIVGGSVVIAVLLYNLFMVWGAGSLSRENKKLQDEIEMLRHEIEAGKSTPSSLPSLSESSGN